MSRTFAPISIDELKAKIDAVCNGKGVRPLLNKLDKDIKVQFDLENVIYEETDPNGLIGYHTENGLTWCGFAAGGDWEHPVFFMVYWDGKKLRGYVPTEGNPWNSITKQAYGNDEEQDLKDAKKRWPEIYTDLDRELLSDDFEFDQESIRKDFMDRIKPASDAKKNKPLKKKSFEKRITDLKFYGTGDEAYELFQATCSLCYKMSGIGDPKQTETLCQWAEQMAAESYEYALQEEDGLTDFAQGYWGN
jgi:hypothetical protein